MSVQPNPRTQVDEEAGQAQSQGFGSTGERFVPLDGLGNLLFEMHSTMYAAPLFKKLETSLQFYEHVVKATVSRKLWCFPERSETVIIPRFKIVDCAFTLGPRFAFFLWLIMLLSIILISIGTAVGGCKNTMTTTYEGYSYFSDSYYPTTITFYNSGACASLVIGYLMLVFCAIAFVLILFFYKLNYVRLDTVAAKKRGPFALFDRSIRSYDYCFKKIGFKHSAYDKAIFDQFYIMDYVCKPFGKQSTEDMYEYHVFSHFNHVGLADPIQYDVGRNHRVSGAMAHRNVKQRHHSTNGTKIDANYDKFEA